MNGDIRISTDFFENPKIKRLQSDMETQLGQGYGATSVLSLIQLWTWVGKNRPNGILKNMDTTDIELSAGWEGPPGTFVDICLRRKLIDKLSKGYKIHDWEENQPWVYHAKERSEKARKAVKARWDKKLQKDDKLYSENTTSIPVEYDKNTNSNTPSPNPIPYPNPNPNPDTQKNKTTTSPRKGKPKSEPKPSSKTESPKYEQVIADEFELFWESYPPERRQDRKRAFKAFTKVFEKSIPSEVKQKRYKNMALHLNKYLDECEEKRARGDEKYIKMPATWLNAIDFDYPPADYIPSQRPMFVTADQLEGDSP
jgi:hypothetical protein